MNNKKITYILKITKVDEDEKVLPGVKFGIYDLEDNLVLQPKAHCVKCVFQIKD